LNGPRPEQLVVVVGTGTEVGKTWVSVALLEAARAAGLTVAARKPAQSFDPRDETTDADLLASASGDEPTTVCPPQRWYEVPYAPPMAADSLGRPLISLDDLSEELVWPDPPVALGVVEMAGGVASPIAHDGDQRDLAGMLEPDHVVLVADAGLGTISAVRLALGSLDEIATDDEEDRIVTVLNRFDPESELHQRNLQWLQNQGINVVVGPTADAAACGLNLFRWMWPAFKPGPARDRGNAPRSP
jgi:dethiobiotin synthetase